MENKITFDDEMLRSAIDAAKYDTYDLDVKTLRAEINEYLERHPQAIESGPVYTYDGKPLDEHDKKLLFLIRYLIKFRKEEDIHYNIDPDVTAEERIEIIK